MRVILHVLSMNKYDFLDESKAMPEFVLVISPRPLLPAKLKTFPASQHGFTLVELMIVGVIAAMIMVIGLPSYKFLLSSNSAGAEINALLADLQHARAEAVKQGQSVQLCAADTAHYQSSGATFACSGSTTWTNGWIGCLASACSAATYASGLISIHAPLTSGSTLTGDVPAVTFNYFGFSTYASARSITDTPSGGVSNFNQQKTLCISGVGSLQTVTGDNTTCP
jgi:type IV fimbrial biogenesis protein FimT